MKVPPGAGADPGVKVPPGANADPETLPVHRLLTGVLDSPPAPSVEHTGRSVSLLTAYVEDLYQANPIYSLVSAADAADMTTLTIRHVLDSLAGAPVVADVLRDRKTRTLIDLGSGAGLPGIPLAVVLRDDLDRCLLVERKERRVRFLASAISRLALPCLKILQADAERPAPEARKELRGGPPPVVVFRAYRPLTGQVLRNLERVFPPGTTIIAWKGRPESTGQEMETIRNSPMTRFHERYPLTVPYLDRERSLLVFSLTSG